MPRYFFHLYDDVFVRDDHGIQLPDAGAARQAAVAGVRAMLCEQVRKGRLCLGHRIEVEDEAGTPILSMAFGDAVVTQP